MKQTAYKTKNTFLTDIAKNNEYDDYSYIVDVLVEQDAPCVMADFIMKYKQDLPVYVNEAQPSDIRKILNILADFGIVYISHFPDRTVTYEISSAKLTESF